VLPCSSQVYIGYILCVVLADHHIHTFLRFPVPNKRDVIENLSSSFDGPTLVRFLLSLYSYQSPYSGTLSRFIHPMLWHNPMGNDE
jgi:hypothetical protein